MAASWVLAPCLVTLRAEVNSRWPNRDKSSDGTIGDAAHASRASDHNPWLNNTVRAIDIDEDGIDGPGYAERLRKLGAAGDARLVGGGYVIYEGRIASETQGWAWRPYTGANAHKHHIHVSVSRNVAGYTSKASWGVSTLGAGLAAPHAAAPGVPTFPGVTREGMRDCAATKAFQQRLKDRGWKITVDGDHGPGTTKVIAAFQDEKGLDPVDGVGGKDTWTALWSAPVD